MLQQIIKRLSINEFADMMHHCEITVSRSWIALEIELISVFQMREKYIKGGTE